MPGGNTVAIELQTRGAQQAASSIGVVKERLRDLATGASHLNVGVANLAKTMASTAVMMGAWKAVNFAENQYRGIVRAAAEFQRLSYSIGLFSESAKEARQSEEWLTDLGVQSFGIKRMEKAFVDLRSVGLKPTREELEGLVGYMIGVQKTPEQFSESVDKMAQLFQNSAIGFDDAFREITEHYRFAATALKELLGITDKDLSDLSKRRAVDFSTLIRSIMQYAAQNYRGGLTGSTDMWDMLVQGFYNRLELLQKMVTQGDWFPQLRNWLRTLNQDIDNLRQNGTLEAWAFEIGEALRELVESLVGGELNLKTFKDLIVSTIKTTREFVDALKSLKDNLSAVWGVVSSFSPSGAAAVGIVTLYLFGSKPAFVLGLIGSAVALLKQLEDKKATVQMGPTGWYDGVGIDQPGNPPGAYGGFDFGAFAKEQANRLGEYVKRRLEENKAVQEMRRMAEQVGSLGAFRASIPDQSMVRKSMPRLPQDHISRLKRAGYTDEQIGAMARSRFHERSLADEEHRQWKTGYGNVPGMIGADTAHDDLKARAATIINRLKDDARLAGLTEYERYAERERIKYDDLMNNLAQQWKLIEVKAKAITKVGGDGWGAVEDQFKTIREQKREADAAMETLLAGEKAKYDQLAGERLGEVTQSIERFESKYKDVQTEANQVFEGVQSDLFGQKGMDLEGAQAEANKRTSNWIQSIDRMGTALYETYQEAWQKVAKTMPDGWEQMQDGLNEQYQAWVAFAKDKKEDIAAAGKEWADEYVAAATASLKQRKADVNLAWQEVFGSRGDIGQAQADQLLMQGVMQGLQFRAGSDERTKLRQLFERKAWEAKTMGSSDMAGGMAIGLQAWEREIPTQAELGLSAVNSFRSGIEDLSSSIADLVVDGKANFEDLARSVSKSLATMTLNAIITTTVFNALKAVTGLGGTRVPNFSGLLASGYSATPRAAGGSVSPGEWYLVGEKGPELLRAGGSGHVHPNRELGGGLQTTINVTVNGGAGGSGKPGDNKAMADQLASAVKATFNDYLRDQMRPGGLLNQGRVR